MSDLSILNRNGDLMVLPETRLQVLRSWFKGSVLRVADEGSEHAELAERRGRDPRHGDHGPGRHLA
jgi:hypothetical protein